MVLWISFLALFLLALIKVKTVNLRELAVGFESKALKESNYKRLQRFFRVFELDYSEIAKIVVIWMRLPQPWGLSLDWTTWEFGDHCYNILTLGIVHEGVAILIWWWLLKKKGNSNSDELMQFIEAILKIRCLSGDREFIGQAWLRYLLLEPSMSFRLRIRATNKIQREGKAKACQSRLRPLGDRRISTTQRWLSGLGLSFPSQQKSTPSQECLFVQTRT